MKTSYRQIEDLLLKSYELRYNLVSNKIQWKCSEGYYVDLEEYDLNSILRFLKKSELQITKQELVQILNSDAILKYNPLQIYFESLQPWSQDQPDYISQLANTIEMPEASRHFWRVWLRKWLIGIVACAIVDELRNETMIVLTGKQGSGKTRWLERLVPKFLKDYYFSGSLNLNNKDSLIILTENFLINLDELENMRKNEAGALKEIISKPFVKVRRPYAALFEKFPRRGSFMGSVNRIDFLKDPTGSRRFLCFEPVSINYEHDVDMNNVYAQAYFLYKEGYSYHFSQFQNAQIEAHNEQFVQLSIEQEVLESIIEKCNRGEEDVRLSTHQLLTHLQENFPFTKRMNDRNLGIALRSMGIDRTKRKNIWLWFIKFKQQSEIAA